MQKGTGRSKVTGLVGYGRALKKLLTVNRRKTQVIEPQQKTLLPFMVNTTPDKLPKCCREGRKYGYDNKRKPKVTH